MGLETVTRGISSDVAAITRAVGPPGVIMIAATFGLPLASAAVALRGRRRALLALLPLLGSLGLLVAWALFYAMGLPTGEPWLIIPFTGAVSLGWVVLGAALGRQQGLQIARMVVLVGLLWIAGLGTAGNPRGGSSLLATLGVITALFAAVALVGRGRRQPTWLLAAEGTIAAFVAVGGLPSGQSSAGFTSLLGVVWLVIGGWAVARQSQSRLKPRDPDATRENP